MPSLIDLGKISIPRNFNQKPMIVVNFTSIGIGELIRTSEDYPIAGCKSGMVPKPESTHLGPVVQSPIKLILGWHEV